MKKMKIIGVVALFSLLALTSQAQTPGELLMYSQHDYSFGTARSAAMGGAFTSLGADLSSMSINPAGLGMYSRSEAGITLSLSQTDVSSSLQGRTFSSPKTNFSVGNVGIALNLYQGAGALTSFTLGFGYNKLVDFNRTSRLRSGNSKYSILDALAIGADGYSEDALGEATDNDPYLAFRQPPIDRWGSILAYQTRMIDPENPGSTIYFPRIAEGSIIAPSMRNVTKGSIGEYTISGGMNIQNILYVGATVGIQDIYYHNRNNYAESFMNNSTGLYGMNYERVTRMSGVGVNFKIGAVLRPTTGLRIGVALHTPTYISIDRNYREYMGSSFNNIENDRYFDSPNAPANYDVNTPTRLLTGLSYTIPGVGIISADYERVWYDGMQLKKMSWQYNDQINAEVKDLYKPADNFRVGLEANPLKSFFLRLGYAHYGDMQRINVSYTNQYNITSYESYSGGIGYRFGSYSLDFAYVNTKYNYAPYELFVVDQNDFTGMIDTKQNRNTFSLSFSGYF